MSKNKFPITVRNGNVRVKIYKTPTHGFDSFTVAYYFGGKRQRRTFADLDTAKQEAEIAANKICAGELDVLTLTNSDRTAYVRSMELLKPFNTPLEMAVMQFTEAAKVLGGVSLLEAARFYTKHHNGKITSKRVPEVVTELLEAKERDGVSAVYLKDLRTRLGLFAKAFACPISMVLSAEIQDYLRGLATGARSKNNTRQTIHLLFHFARGRGYLPKGPTEADDLPRAKERPTPIGLFTPAEMATVLKHAEQDLVPFIAIGAFAGLRHAEILRLDWSEVDLAGGHIEIKAAKAKTASRRLVPILDNLKAWLTPHHQGSGKVVTLSDVNLNLRLRTLARSEAVNAKWPHNGLRHSFISYRVAKVQNVAQVALEAGNSPQVIFAHYRELVRPAEAEKWFSVVPPGVIAEQKKEKAQEPEKAANALPTNVVPVPLPAAVA